jgi:predicted glycoside hydrolase/deacetylase ChbG (UPF0249 family)
MIIADDFGLDPAHDKVIIDLLRNGKINGTSVMVSDRLDAKGVEELKAIRLSNNIQIGLHLNLTEEMEGIRRFGSIISLWLDLMFGRIAAASTADSFNQQLIRFKEAFGFLPDFIDGHQHCHAIAQNRSALLKIAKELTAENDEFWVRSPAAGKLAHAISECRRGGIKTLLIMWWGEGLRSDLQKNHIKTNSDFSGFIPYKSATAFTKTYKDIFENRRDDCLIMVHPGSANANHEVEDHANELRALEAKMLADLKS